MSHLKYVFRPEDELEKSHKLLSINALKAHGVDSEHKDQQLTDLLKMVLLLAERPICVTRVFSEE